METALVDFAEEARRFCRFVEEASALSLPDRLREARVRLAALCSAACHLPELAEPVGAAPRALHRACRRAGEQ